MGELAQIRTVFTNFSGQPGYNLTYWFADPVASADVTTAVNAMFAFWNSVVVQMSQGISFQVETAVSILDPADGHLIRIMTGPTTTQSNFASAGPYTAGAGAVITWSTGAVHGRKRLRGRTFVVPLGGGGYDSSGTLSAAALSSLNTNATTLLSHASFGVWGRPRKADATHVPPITALTGAWSAATAFSIRDHVALLKTRRD